MRRDGLAHRANVPVIFDELWQYHEAASDYLWDRARGEAFAKRAKRTPTRQSLETFARALCDGLQFMDWNKLDWREVDYMTHLVGVHPKDGSYQNSMLRGTWAKVKGQPLGTSTINQRIDEFTYFLQWGAKTGRRGPIDVPMTTYNKRTGGIKSYSHRFAEAETRAYRVRPKPMDLAIPTDQGVIKWLNTVKIEKGMTKALMCEVVVKTAIRREECSQWRIGFQDPLSKTWYYLPFDRSKWKVIGDMVSVRIRYGCKGEKYADQFDDLYGPEGDIDIPLYLAEKLHYYEKFIRPKNRLVYINAAKDPSEKRRRLAEVERRFFLSEFTGKPIEAKQFYKAWTGVSYQPIDGWSPHLGRHYWPCRLLLQKATEREAALSAGVELTADWLSGMAGTDLLLEVKPQLRHVDERSTQIYLQWLRKMYASAKRSDEWVDHLEKVTFA